jgi:hypothetical protein
MMHPGARLIRWRSIANGVKLTYPSILASGEWRNCAKRIPSTPGPGGSAIAAEGDDVEFEVGRSETE